jgi:hypothetical protein
VSCAVCLGVQNYANVLCLEVQHEKRDLISIALGARISNPGSVSRRAKCSMFRLAVGLLGVMLQRCVFNRVWRLGRGWKGDDKRHKAAENQQHSTDHM